MPIKSLKNKITSLASGEILGETTEEEKRKQEQKEMRQEEKKKAKHEKETKAENAKREKREPKEKKPAKERNTAKENIFKRRSNNNNDDDEYVDFKEKPKVEEQGEKVRIKGAVEGYEDVLSILEIKETIEVDPDFESKDLDYIEFSQTTPLGFDFDEVTDFISRMKYTLNKYESALKQRDREVIIVASEVKKVEQKMVEQNQAKELEKMIGGMTEEERLIEENMDLKIEINNLKTKLIGKGEGSGDTSKLENEIKALRAENEMLIRKDIQRSSQEPSEDDFKLPSANNDFKLPSSEIVKSPNSKSNPLPAFNTQADVEMPKYVEDEEDNFLDNLMKNRGNEKNLENMMKDMGDDYDEKRR